MPLEATLIVADNSEYMRNGDYQPSRFEAEEDAVRVLFQTKIDSNPENTVGFMTMAGKSPEVLVTHTKEVGQIYSALHNTQIGGSADIPTAISVAQLALKHRANKNLRQRIIVLVGSPLEGQAADEKFMTRLAKKLKKNNVAIDFVVFGDAIEEGEQSILRTFVENANSGDNCHYLSVPPGAHLLSDAILSSPILAGDHGIPEEAMGDAPSGSGGGGGAGFEFGVDPSLDPELAMALRMSMEEEQARQAAAARSTGQASSSSDSSSTPAPAAATATDRGAETPKAAAPAAAASSDDDEEDEDAMLARALALSQEQDVEMADGEEEESEEEAIKRAIEMSMKGQGDQK